MCDSGGGHHQASSENIVFNFQQKGIKKEWLTAGQPFNSEAVKMMLSPGESFSKFTVIRPTHLRPSLVSGLMRTGLSHRFPIWEMCGLLCRCCGLVGGLGLGRGGGDGAGEGGRVKQPLRQ